VSPSFICLLLPSLCAHTEENLETASDLVLSQEDKLQTHSTVHEISRETGRPIHRLSLSRIIYKDLHQKCFKRRCAQELTDTNCATRTKRTKLQLQTFRSMPPTLFSLRTKRCSRSFHLTIGRTESVADCGNFWKRSLAF